MRSEEVMQRVTRHLDDGGVVKLTVDKGGRRFAKLVRWKYWGPKLEVSGATAVRIEQMLGERHHARRAQLRNGR